MTQNGLALSAARLPRLDSLTGLRFFAAYFVLQHHFTNFAQLPILYRYTGFGATGVTFFFILSGFVLTWSFERTDTPQRFYWRRFARIMPLHILTTVIAIPVFYIWREQSVDPLAMVLSFALIHAWVPHATTYFAGNPASWSLSCEAFFYAVHPFVVRPLNRMNRTSLIAALVVLGATTYLVAEEALGLPDNVVGWLLYVSPLFRIGEFLLGMALAVAMKRGFRLPIGVVPSAALLAAWFIVMYDFAPHLGADGRLFVADISYVLIPALYAMVIAAAAGLDLNGKPSIFRSHAMVKLGEWSFALYLIHATIIYAFVEWLGARPSIEYSNVFWLALISVTCIAASAVLYEFVEHPIERRLRGMLPASPIPQTRDLRQPAV